MGEWISLVAAIIALSGASAALLLAKRTWLTLARNERLLADTDRSLAESMWRSRPEMAAERLAKALEHDRLARLYDRRAWPWKQRVGVSGSGSGETEKP